MNDLIYQAIERLVRTEFSSADIEAVHIREDKDSDGDNIYEVTIVMKAQNKFDPRKASKLLRNIFPAMQNAAEGQDIPFPILSFLSKSDYNRVSEAA